MRKIKKFINFVKEDLWRIKLENFKPAKSFFIRMLRVIVLSFRGFNEDKCRLRASALTFFSLLSIVPVLALAFGIAKGFGLEKILENQLLLKFQGQQEIINRIISFSNTMLENTKGGMVAGIGVIFLLWLVIRVLGSVEDSFNFIWGIKEPRSIGRKFSDYLSVILICPVVFIASSSITMAITSKIEYIAHKIYLLGTVSPVLFSLIKMLPFAFICSLFAFIYIFMPNTKVNLKSGIIGGIIAGIIYQLIQWGYINFQIGVAKYNAIYGSFAALPLFLIWVQVSWLIVLFGAEISFAFQNVHTYEFEPDCLNASYSFKKLLALRIFNLIAKDFISGKNIWSAEKISGVLDIPVRLVRQILYDLQQANLVSEIKNSTGKSFVYQPSRDACLLTIYDVIEFLEKSGTENIPVKKTSELSAISETLENFKQKIKELPSNKKIIDF